MMTTTSDLHDLMSSVEEARTALHPDLDAGFVRRVVEIEHEAGEDDQAALAAIRKAVEALVGAVSVDSSGA